MSSPGAARAKVPMPELPTGAVVSTYDHYADAKQAVDVLARSEFPVNQISILGNDMRSVERVTGRLTYGRVAMTGALSGAYLGLFLGLLLFIFQSEMNNISGIFIAAVAIGIGFGMLFNVLTYSLNRNRRAYSAIVQFVAGRYDIIAPAELVGSARMILAGAARNVAPPAGATPTRSAAPAVKPTAQSGAAPTGQPSADATATSPVEPTPAPTAPAASPNPDSAPNAKPAPESEGTGSAQ